MDRVQTYTLTQAAALIGVAPITLKRWLLTKKVSEVGRDRNGWRVFTLQDIQRIGAFATRIEEPRAQ